jgi:hypothetical protein
VKDGKTKMQRKESDRIFAVFRAERLGLSEIEPILLSLASSYLGIAPARAEP